ncbi:hypothetical protein [Erwinia mallotivora]|uniref:hypothetical protein n=1 Tax=Erwinia mallotivora TaxID=69222 RepID=UPI0021C0FB8C|nr:hypothetical protein [Erwinia mallotivora]
MLVLTRLVTAHWPRHNRGDSVIAPGKECRVEKYQIAIAVIAALLSPSSGINRTGI